MGTNIQRLYSYNFYNKYLLILLYHIIILYIIYVFSSKVFRWWSATIFFLFVNFDFDVIILCNSTYKDDLFLDYCQYGMSVTINYEYR